MAAPAQIDLDDHLESAMAEIIRLGQAIADIDVPRVKQSAEFVNRIVGPAPADSRCRSAIARVHVETVDGRRRGHMEMKPVVRVSVTDVAAARPDIQDFRAERPTLDVTVREYDCMGPMNKVTHLPDETCQKHATRSFYFPHQQGLAFLFACDEHAISLGEWAGRKFGGCFGGDVAGAPRAMKLAAQRGAQVDLPHDEEFERLVPVPNPPALSTLFTRKNSEDPETHEAEREDGPEN
jgi:hypothetical protein